MTFQSIKTLSFAAALICAPAALAQTVANPYGSAAEEAKAVTIYQQSIQYPLAKTYSSREEALADANRPSYSDYAGGTVEIFTQPLPQSQSAVIPAQSYTQAAPVVTRTAVTTPQGRTMYTVMSGDTLYSIGRRYGLKPSAIMNANGLTGSAINPGQVLIIPVAQTNIVRTAPEVVTGTSEGEVAVVRNVSPIPASNIYAVLPGDTLYSIARRACVTPADIASASGITVGSTLQPGQRLTLPNGACQ